MLTDIFAYRYADVPMWDVFEERDRRLIVQAFRIVTEQLYQPYVDGKESDWAQAKWKLIHDKLSMELGLQELSKRAYSYQTTFNGKPYTQSVSGHGTTSANSMCARIWKCIGMQMYL